MLSAERLSVSEIRRQSYAHEARVRSSIVQAATVPFGVSEGQRYSIQPGHLSGKPSIKRFSTVLGNKSSRLRGVYKFEIVLDRMARSDEVEEALGNFRRDSLTSLQAGADTPSVKNYVDLESEFYEPGEVVSGHVLLMLSRNILITDITVKLAGVYIVSFEKRIEGECTSQAEQLIFLELKTVLYKREEDTQVSPGAYRYYFKFQLPINIPGTMFYEQFQDVYEGASVVYSIEAVLNSKSVDKKYERSTAAREILSIVRRVPERLERIYHKAYCITKTSKFRLCCLELGSIMLWVSLPKLIFMEGDTLIIHIKMSNDSKLRVKEIAIALVQYISFRNKSQTEYVLRGKKTLLAHHMPMDNLGYGDVENRLAMTLPEDMLPSTMANLVPPTSYHSLQIRAQSQSELTPDNQNTNAVEEVTNVVGVDEVQLEEDDFTLLEMDYHTLYDVAYYIQIKAMTTSEWFSLKGPEIHFPVTIEGADTQTRKSRQGNRQAPIITNTEIDNTNHEQADEEASQDDNDDDDDLAVKVEELSSQPPIIVTEELSSQPQVIVTRKVPSQPRVIVTEELSSQPQSFLTQQSASQSQVIATKESFPQCQVIVTEESSSQLQSTVTEELSSRHPPNTNEELPSQSLLNVKVMDN